MNIYSGLWYIGALIIAYVVMTLGCWFFGGVPLHPAALYHGATGFEEWYQYTILAGFGVTFAGALVNPFRFKKAEYGEAHWATLKEIEEMGLLEEKPGGFILGRLKNGKLLRMYNDLSVLIFAGPGSGKTAGVVIPSILSDNNSIIVHDPKGELCDKTGPYRREAWGSKVVKLAFGEKDSAKWNPLSAKELPEEWADKVVQVDRLAATFYPEGKDPHWAHSARDIFKFWAGVLIHKQGETSFSEVLNTAFGSDPKSMIANELDTTPDLPEALRVLGNEAMGKSDGEFGSVMSTFKNGLAVFTDPRVAENTATSDISIKDLRAANHSVYVVVSNADQERLKTLMTAFFEFACLSLIIKEPSKEELGVSFLLDEFVRLGKMTQLQKLPAISRSFRVRTMYVLQSMAQLRDIYGKEGASELKDTCSYHVVFSQNEQSNAEELSKAIGKVTAIKKSLSSSWSKAGTTSESKEGRPLVLPQEWMSLEGKIQSLGPLHGKPLKYRTILMVEKKFQTPVHCYAPMWFKDKFMLNAITKVGR